MYYIIYSIQFYLFGIQTVHSSQAIYILYTEKPTLPDFYLIALQNVTLVLLLLASDQCTKLLLVLLDIWHFHSRKALYSIYSKSSDFFISAHLFKCSTLSAYVQYTGIERYISDTCKI